MSCKTNKTPLSAQTIQVGMAHNLILQQNDNENFKILDVRTVEEFNNGHILNAIHRDIVNDKASLLNLDKDKTYLIYCHSGRRSQHALDYLKENGFKRLFNMDGGIVEWKNLQYTDSQS